MVKTWRSWKRAILTHDIISPASSKHQPPEQIGMYMSPVAWLDGIVSGSGSAIESPVAGVGRVTLRNARLVTALATFFRPSHHHSTEEHGHLTGLCCERKAEGRRTEVIRAAG